MSVWDDLVGQERVVAELRRSVGAAQALLRGEAALAMTHAWLFTGPPGSGRSVAARAFAAALQCELGGCGHCQACRTALAGTSGDLEVVATRSLSIKVDAVRELVGRAARRPIGGRWLVVVVEDADRLTEHAANALLKAIEEPAPRTVWVLCAPALEDVLVTIRSRCRHLALRTPTAASVAAVLERRDGVDPAMASFAARASQGHVGRARRLAVDERARLRRAEILRLPTVLDGVGSAFAAAGDLVAAADEEAKIATAELDVAEAEELGRALGVGTTGRGAPAGAAAQLKELEREQKARATRTRRDALDRALVDLSSWYRDVLSLQLDAGVGLVNAEVAPALEREARASTAEVSVRRLAAILACRAAIEANAAPLLAVEALTVALRAA